MGYSIYITRKEANFRGPDISREEWRRVVEMDPELVVTVDDADSLIAVYRPDEWEERPAHHFCYRDGRIFVSKPYKFAMMKMLSLARALNARVVGERGEFYSTDGKPNGPTHYVLKEED